MKNESNNKMTRKEALKRMGKYAALTAAGTFLILNPLRLKQVVLVLQIQAGIHLPANILWIYEGIFSSNYYTTSWHSFYFVVRNSNQYIVTAKSLYSLIEAFLASGNEMQFEETVIKLGYDNQLAERFFKEIGQFLEDSNVVSEEEVGTESLFSGTHRKLSHYYQMDDKTIIVHYSSAILRSLVHPQLEHLETLRDKTSVHCEFDIYNDENHLVMFKDEKLIGSWNENEYHLLQGKFAMHILCALHNNEEMDWMGTFHASTVAKNDKAIMVIGDSGKGKSTFIGLLFGSGLRSIG